MPRTYNRVHPHYRPVEPTYQRTNHILHAILSLFLCGLWLPVWAVCALQVAANNKGIQSQYEAAWAEHIAYWQARGWNG